MSDDAPLFGGADEVALESAVLRRLRSSIGVDLVHHDGRTERTELPSPQAGFGGSEIVVSPDQHWAALFVYSGQSEQGWELFELAPTLRHVGGLPYVRGEGMAPAFSPDSRYLAMAVVGEAAGWTERATGRHAEDILDASAAEDESVLVDWAVLYWQRIPEESDAPTRGTPAFPEHAAAADTRLPRSGSSVHQVVIGTRIPRAMEPDELFEWHMSAPPRFVASDRLVVAMPWGEELEIQLPVAGPITTGAAPAA